VGNIMALFLLHIQQHKNNLLKKFEYADENVRRVQKVNRKQQGGGASR